MEDIIFLLAKGIQTGGPYVVTCFLLTNLAYFIWLSERLAEKLDEKTDEFKTLIDSSNETTRLFTEALNDVKCLIAEIKGSLK